MTIDMNDRFCPIEDCGGFARTVNENARVAENVKSEDVPVLADAFLCTAGMGLDNPRILSICLEGCPHLRFDRPDFRPQQVNLQINISTE